MATAPSGPGWITLPNGLVVNIGTGGTLPPSGTNSAGPIVAGGPKGTTAPGPTPGPITYGNPWGVSSSGAAPLPTTTTPVVPQPTPVTLPQTPIAPGPGGATSAGGTGGVPYPSTLPPPGNTGAPPIVKPPPSTLQDTLLNPPGLGGWNQATPIVVGGAGQSTPAPTLPKPPSVGTTPSSGGTTPSKAGSVGGPSAAESGNTSTSSGSNQPAPNAPGPASVTPPTGLPKEANPTTGPGSPWATWGQRAGGFGNAPGATGTAKSKLGNTILTGGTPYMPGNTQQGVNQSIGSYQDMQKKYAQSYSDMLNEMSKTSAGVPKNIRPGVGA